MASTRIKLNSAGVDQMLKSSGVRSFLRGRAESVLAAAQSSAPSDSGDYRANLRIEETTGTELGISFKFGSNDRPIMIVVSDVPHTYAVEANFGVLSRALDAGR